MSRSVDLLLRHIRRGAEHAGIDPRRVIFEITETAAVANFARRTRFADELSTSAAGSRWTTSASASGRSYVKHLPVDFLKIDGEFVATAPPARRTR